MRFSEFASLYDELFMPIIQEVSQNNSLVQINDIERHKNDVYHAYVNLRDKYKNQIFNKDDKALLDRHKIASCICGAFLEVPAINKTLLIKNIVDYKKPVDSFFFYTNEFIAFSVAIRVLGIFMIASNDDDEIKRRILCDFPIMPDIMNNKKGIWNNFLFNLSQIKDDKQIGIDHYDTYAYAMQFFMLENHFYRTLAQQIG